MKKKSNAYLNFDGKSLDGILPKVPITILSDDDNIYESDEPEKEGKNEKTAIMHDGFSLPELSFTIKPEQLLLLTNTISNKNYSDELHRFSDITQINMVAAGLATLDGIYKIIRSIYSSGSCDPLELNRIMLSLNKSFNMINSSLANLGITGAKRDASQEENPFAELLAKIEFDVESIPELQHEFIKNENITQAETDSMLDEIKQPIDLFSAVREKKDKIQPAKDVSGL